MGTPRLPIVDASGKPCGTPGAVYTSKLAGRKITLEIDLPVYLRFNAAEEQRIFGAIHNRLVLAMEDLYRECWGQFAGKTIDGDGPLPREYNELFKLWNTRA